MFKLNDFFILKDNYGNISKNAVGVIEELNSDGITAKVFMLGDKMHIDILLEKIEYLDITQTGKPNKYKICNVCHILKEDYVDFEINQTDALGRKTTRPSCRSCRIKIDGVKLSLSEKRRMRQNTPVKYFECPICGKGSIPGVTANLVIDHDHNTGLARDWLCDSCNTGLGRFKDNIELMEKAIAYLKKYNQNNS